MNERVKMLPRDVILALLVVTVWGANFTVIKLGLAGVPPLLLVALRYTLTAVPAVFFVSRPKIEFKYCVAYGLAVGVGQFGSLFYAMNVGMPAGVASVVLQSQAFFTVLFAAVLLKEPVTKSQLAGLMVAATGLYLIAGNMDAGNTAAIPMFAFLLTLIGAAFWGISNIIVRHAASLAASRGEGLEMLNLIVWSSLIPPLPLLTLSFFIEKPEAILFSLSNLNFISVFAILYLAFGATLFGFGTWSGLLSRYPAGQVAPVSLLVPVTGLITAQIVLGEKLSFYQWIGGLAVLMGLAVSTFGLPRVGVKKRDVDA